MLIQIVIQYLDYFAIYIYIPEEYIRDQTDFYQCLQGRGFSYKAIYNYFRILARGQGGLLNKRRNIYTFLNYLLRLLSLRTIKLSVARALEDRLLQFSYRLFLNSRNSSKLYLKPVLRGIIVAQDSRVFIKLIEIQGIQLSPATIDNNILKLIGAAIKYIKSIKLVDSPSLLEFMSSVPLLYLR